MASKMQATNLLDNYTKIIFDMDGVLTSEQNYWNSAALSVYELLNSQKYFGEKSIDIPNVFNNTPLIRKNLFSNDKLIVLLKEKGVNTNWDLAYLALAGIVKFGLNSEITENNYDDVYKYYLNLNLKAPEIYNDAENSLHKHFTNMDCSRFGKLWTILQTSFNEWYYGKKYFVQAYNNPPSEPLKTGFMENEQPLHSLEITKNILQTLKNKGKILGIGTGRPRMELMVPLENWGLTQYFDLNSCVNHDDILNAQNQLSKKGITHSLSKPHPWIFLKAAFGKHYSDEAIIAGDYDKDYLKNVLIVGDAGADIIAAKAMPSAFVAVLTGVSGQNARGYFESMKAEYIIDSIQNLI